MHPDQLDVTTELVRSLVDEQFPQWAGLPIEPVESVGTVNAVFRIGSELVVRLPLQPREIPVAAADLKSEADCARALAHRTRFPIPVPIAFGEPGPGYPMPWSVYTWLPGRNAFLEDPRSSKQFASDLAEFILDVRSIGVDRRTFEGPGRGGELQTHDEWMRQCFRRSQDLLDVETLSPIWQRLRRLPRDAPDVTTHGDLTPGNVLVSEGRLVGVLDVGGLGPADPALDLVSGWHLLETEARQVLKESLGCDDLEWERGKAWAFEQAMGVVWYYRESNRAMSEMGRLTLDRIAAGETERSPHRFSKWSGVVDELP